MRQGDPTIIFVDKSENPQNLINYENPSAFKNCINYENPSAFIVGSK